MRARPAPAPPALARSRVARTGGATLSGVPVAILSPDLPLLPANTAEISPKLKALLTIAGKVQRGG